MKIVLELKHLDARAIDFLRWEVQHNRSSSKDWVMRRTRTQQANLLSRILTSVNKRKAKEAI